MPSIPKIISVAVFALLCVGYAYRKNQRVHIALMCSAVGIDVALVLFLELTRGVVENLPQKEMTALFLLHILTSLVVISLYVVQIVTGLRKRRGVESTTHGKSGIAILPLRFANLVTTFLLFS